jgi:hypothetical protein
MIRGGVGYTLLKETGRVRQTVQIETILQRLECLERDNRRWKVLASMVVVICGGFLLLGAAGSRRPHIAEEIRARSFVLVDKHGTVLARLGQLPHGSLGLGFYDEGRKARLLLGIDADGGTSVSVYGKDGRGSAVLMAGQNGATSLRLLDTRWHVRASLATWPDGSPFLHLSDRNGNDRALLTYSERAVMPNGDIVRHPDPALVLFDAEGGIRWRAP